MKPLNEYIDHTLLKPEATALMIQLLCHEAKAMNFYAVCVNPTWIDEAKKQLAGTQVKVAAVVGFPLGATFPEVKALEAKLCQDHGADEIDMVINIGALKSKDYSLVTRDIEGVIKSANIPVKVIIECSLLSEEEKIIACDLCKALGAAYVKTSTGFGPSGATVQDIKLLKEKVSPLLKVKASGGIRNKKSALAMIDAGADRVGTSYGIAMMQEKEEVE